MFDLTYVGQSNGHTVNACVGQLVDLTCSMNIPVCIFCRTLYLDLTDENLY